MSSELKAHSIQSFSRTRDYAPTNATVRVRAYLLARRCQPDRVQQAVRAAVEAPLTHEDVRAALAAEHAAGVCDDGQLVSRRPSLAAVLLALLSPC